MEELLKQLQVHSWMTEVLFGPDGIFIPERVRLDPLVNRELSIPFHLNQVFEQIRVLKASGKRTPLVSQSQKHWYAVRPFSSLRKTGRMKIPSLHTRSSFIF